MAQEDATTCFRAAGPIVLVPHDPRWVDDFHVEANAIRRALPGLLAGVHHIGSTAIPGIVAKPVIDLLSVVVELDLLDARTSALVALGYEPMGEFGISGRRYFRKDTPDGVRTHQIHAFRVGSPHVRRHLAFRDFLRSHPDDAERYGALKLGLAKRFSPNMNAYTDGKTAFIRDIEARASPPGEDPSPAP